MAQEQPASLEDPLQFEPVHLRAGVDGAVVGAVLDVHQPAWVDTHTSPPSGLAPPQLRAADRGPAPQSTRVPCCHSSALCRAHAGGEKRSTAWHPLQEFCTASLSLASSTLLERTGSARPPSCADSARI